MKWFVFLGLLLGVGIFAGGYWYLNLGGAGALAPAKTEIERYVEPSLQKYSFERLQEVEFEGGPIEIGAQVEEESEEYDSYIFYFEVENLNDSDAPFRGSGLMNVPIVGSDELEEDDVGEAETEYPVLVQFRGFVPGELFTPGEGTRRSGEYFASQGYITLAPDMLGYGESDNPSEDPLEERFQTYTTALSLLASVKSIDDSIEEYNLSVDEEVDEDVGEITARWDGGSIGVWGHSNGGHIALASAAILGHGYPVVLWNPVSKHFPYSILFYTDEYDDQGAALRRLVAEFEEVYQIEEFSPPNYYRRIQAPIQLHQGLTDREILPWWSEELVTQLEEEEIEVEYIEHSNADHNLMPDGWDAAVTQSDEFYQTQFEEEEQ